MWKQLLLSRLVEVMTESKESCEEAKRHFLPRVDSGSGEKVCFAAAWEQLTPPEQHIIRRFLTEQRFAWTMAHFLGFMASAQVERYALHEGPSELTEEFNGWIVGWNRSHCPGERLERLDEYEVINLLDLVGDELLLGYNSVITTCPATWLTFLAAYAVVNRCSVWEQQPEKSLAQMLLKWIPTQCYLPTWLLVWILSPEETQVLANGFLKCKGKKDQTEVETRLVHILAYGKNLKSSLVRKICENLVSWGITDEQMQTLVQGNNADAVKAYLREVYEGAK